MTRSAKRLASLPLADPEPRVIRIFKALCAGDPDSIRNARKDAGEILSDWIAHEDIQKLQKALGLKRAPKRPRKQKTVDREYAIYQAILNAAFAGISVKTFNLAADAANAVVGKVDEKEAERAWKKWAIAHVPILEDAVAERDEFTEFHKRALALLPPFDRK